MPVYDGIRYFKNSQIRFRQHRDGDVDLRGDPVDQGIVFYRTNDPEQIAIPLVYTASNAGYGRVRRYQNPNRKPFYRTTKDLVKPDSYEVQTLYWAYDGRVYTRKIYFCELPEDMVSVRIEPLTGPAA